MTQRDIIVIGASAGGIQALTTFRGTSQRRSWSSFTFRHTPSAGSPRF
jgi:hypothetical protein